MKRHGWNMLAIAVAVVVYGAASTARAQTSTTETHTTTVTPAPAPEPAPAVVPVQPVQPVQAVPVEAPAAPVRQKQVITETHSDDFMVTIAKSVFFGAITGGLVGGALYIIDHEHHPANVAYWAAGGALVGGTIGVVQVVVDENRAEQAVSSFMDGKGSHERGFAFVPRLVNTTF